MAAEHTDTALAHLPPHDLEAEQSVLGAMLINPNAITVVADTLSADDFYRDTHRLIYRAVLTLYDKGEEVDVVTLGAQLEREGVLERAGGREFVHTLAEFVPAAANAAHYAGIVREQSVLRALIRVGNEIAELGYQHPGDTPTLLDRCEQKVFAIQQSRRVAEFQHIKDVLVSNFEHLDLIMEREGGLSGVGTGFKELDDLTGGLQPANLIVLAARPGVGKTSLALNIAQHVAIKGQAPVAIFSLEMSAQELGERLMCSMASVSSHKLRTGSLRNDDYSNLVQAAGQLEKADIFIDDTAGLNMFELRAKARRLKTKIDLSLDHRRLPAAHGGRRPRRQPSAGSRQHLALHEAAGPRAQRAAHRGVAAQPLPGGARRPRAAARRPARVRRHRAGRGHGDVHLRGPQRPRGQGRREAQDRQEPQRPHRPGPHVLQQGLHALQQHGARLPGRVAARPPQRMPPVSEYIHSFVTPSLDPVALLRALGLEDQAPVVLLDSAGGSPGLARHHYLAWHPLFRLRVRDGIISVDVGAGAGGELARGARELTALAPFAALRAAARLAVLPAAPAADADFPEAEALFGLIAYDAVRYLEVLPDTTRNDLSVPDIDMFLPGVLLRYDLVTGGLLLLDRVSATEHEAAALRARVGHAVARARRPAAARLHGTDMPLFRSNFTKSQYQAVVARAVEYVYAGDIFQANLSQRLDLVYGLPSLHLYQTLRTVNPSPFAGYLHMGDYELVSSSPERLVSLDAQGWAETRPIAGTRPRGERRPQDETLTDELNLDPKDRAEHIMLVDLERNDLGRVCAFGTVRPTELMVNEYYSHVIHIVSNVRGRLRAQRRRRGPGHGHVPGRHHHRLSQGALHADHRRAGDGAPRALHRLLRLARGAPPGPQHRHPHAGTRGRPAVPAGGRRHRGRLRARAASTARRCTRPPACCAPSSPASPKRSPPCAEACIRAAPLAAQCRVVIMGYFSLAMGLVAVVAAAWLATSVIWSVTKLLGRISRTGRRVERFFANEDQPDAADTPPPPRRRRHGRTAG